MISLWHLAWIIPAALLVGALFGVVLAVLAMTSGERARKEDRYDA